jgi:hypothetical protein
LVRLRKRLDMCIIPYFTAPYTLYGGANAEGSAGTASKVNPDTPPRFLTSEALVARSDD